MSTEVGKIEVGDEYDFRGTVVHLYDDGWAGRAPLAPPDHPRLGRGACWHCVKPSQVAGYFGKCSGATS